MKQVKIIIAALVAAVLVSSCGVVNQKSSYQPQMAELQIPLDALEYLGDAQISIEYETNLLFFTQIITINGEDYDRSIKNYGYFGGNSFMGGLGYNLDRAAYKVYEDYPEGQYFMVVRQAATTQNLFLGRVVSAKAVIRVYKFK